MERQLPVVLVADDDKAAIIALTLRLMQSGFRVVSATDGLSAIDAMEKEQPDIALLDIRMPGMDGLGVCEHIRASNTYGNIPVFFLSGAQDGVIRDHMDQLVHTVGADGHIRKPYDGKTIATIVRAALESATRQPPKKGN